MTMRDRFERLLRAPFPELGYRIDEFPLYDSMLAGYASRASQGEVIPVSDVPVPDGETLRCVEGIRAKRDASEEEKLFLQYFDLLEEIRAALQRGERS